MPVTQEPVSVSIGTIMVATDFSPASERATAYAKAIAQRFSSTVEIAHVFNPSIASSYEEALVILPLQERRQNIQDDLERLQSNFMSCGIATRTVSRDGNHPAVDLLRVAKEIGADLIVSGTRSKRGTDRLLLGSTAEAILRNATCPVLTVGPKAEAPKEGALVFKSVLFATDFSAQAAKAAVFALSFAEDSGARFSLCHVIAPYPGWQQEAPIVDGAFESALKRMIPESSYDWCRPECVLEHGQAANGILALADKVDADLIVLGARKASLMLSRIERGVTSDLLAEATCPVLTVC